MRRSKIMWGIVFAASVTAVSVGPVMSQVEQPEYQTEKVDGSIEIRTYKPMIVAEATVQGQRDAAIGEGFKIIAAYIFGANEPNAKIKMTAPVQQQKTQTITMTTPVTQQSIGDEWTVQFVMPRKWTLDTLPKPTDDRVRLQPVQTRKMIVIRFSGRATKKTIANERLKLDRYIEEQGIKVIGEPAYAFYNPPWTLPMFRRNEIMFELGT